MGLFSKLAGIIGSKLQIDVVGSGPQLKNNSGSLDVRNSGDSAYANVRVATPVGDNDAANKLYVDQLSARYIITAQANAPSALIANTGAEHFIVVTANGTGAGSGYLVGQVLWDDGSSAGNVSIIGPTGGLLILTTQAFTGGTVTFAADSLYMWDATASAWVNAGGTLISGAVREIRYSITNAATQDSAKQIPANAYVTSVELEVTTPFSGGATISIGQAGSVSLLMGTGDNTPQVANTYQIMQDTSWGSSALSIRTTVGGSPAAGAGVVIGRYTVPDA